MQRTRLRRPADTRRYAIFSLRRPGLTVRRTRAPRRASMSISASVLNRSMRPRRRSLTRGCDTRRISAVSRCFNCRAAMSFCIWIIRSARTSRCSASSRWNPRSRNTLPVDAVTLSGLPTLTSRQPSLLSLADQRSVSLSGEIHITPGRFPAPFLEGVQYVHGLCETGDVEDPVLQRRADPDLPNAWPDATHRLPVCWAQSLLDTPKLKPGESPRVSREGPNVLSCRAQPLQRLVGHRSVCKYTYNPVKPSIASIA